MIYTEKFKIPLKDIGKDNKIKNRAVLEILENIACYHSDLVGYGVNNIKETKVNFKLIKYIIIELKSLKGIHLTSLKVNRSVWQKSREFH